MKLRYPTEKDLMAVVRTRNSRRTVTAASAKARSGTGAKRRGEQQDVFPACIPYFPQS